MSDQIKILVLGYGNPGRLDDGLGPALAARLQHCNRDRLAVECDYQLNIEDAELIAHYDIVVFADASVNAPEPFEFGKLEACEPMVGFSSHSIAAESLLGLSDQLFQARPEAYALAIRGYDFNGFGEHLSARAENNLAEAEKFIIRWVDERL